MLPSLDQSTPVLRLPVDRTVWKTVDGASVGKPGVSWWALNLAHPFFQDNGEYWGVLHAEVIPYAQQSGREDVFTIAVDTGSGHKIFSFGFPESHEGANIFLNSNQNKGDDKRVLKIALELSAHLPDERLSASLSEKISRQLEKCNGSQKLWDKV